MELEAGFKLCTEMERLSTRMNDGLSQIDHYITKFSQPQTYNVDALSSLKNARKTFDPTDLYKYGRKQR